MINHYHSLIFKSMLERILEIVSILKCTLIITHLMEFVNLEKKIRIVVIINF